MSRPLRPLARRAGLAAMVTAVMVVCAAPQATAKTYDLQLWRFLPHDEAGASTGLDGRGFEDLSRDLALAFQPRFGAPATTVGSLGFDIGYALTLTDINQDASFWTKATEDPGDLLMVSQFQVRKGLPYSFAIGGVFSHLHDSNLFAIGLEVKWAFVEGYEKAPDIGARLHVSTIVGSRDLSTISTGADLQVSKAFGLGGVMQLVPYVAYSFMYTRATSHVLGVFDEGDLTPSTDILPDQNIFTHRGILGLRMVFSVADFGFEAALGRTHSFSMRAGLNF